MTALGVGSRVKKKGPVRDNNRTSAFSFVHVHVHVGSLLSEVQNTLELWGKQFWGPHPVSFVDTCVSYNIVLSWRIHNLMFHLYLCYLRYITNHVHNSWDLY